LEIAKACAAQVFLLETPHLHSAFGFSLNTIDK
jgi:hypothetical protein